jgi:two-component system KDP operon response regulator KdpE
VALRHSAQSALAGASVLRLGAVTLDLNAKKVEREGEAIRLTATQWRLLEVLARHAGSLVTGDTLITCEELERFLAENLK